ncbi:hypothetical protein [Thalassotalea sp. G20_0]|uniref:hypothetical protein n=1 Tax=Thalassotalea sp. G20_0 TaxID=2821093 RepID=UPI00256FC0B1|nr:hypothetical protein [Thalassotalea sp. G20_0]
MVAKVCWQAGKAPDGDPLSKRVEPGLDCGPVPVAGGVPHILADGMTVSGVPLSPYSDRRCHLLGSRFRDRGAGGIRDQRLCGVCVHWFDEPDAQW